jgi:hypothetical protein
VCHLCWDNFRKKTSLAKWPTGNISKFTPELDWMRKFGLDEMYELMFEVAPVDIAMSHAVPVFDGSTTARPQSDTSERQAQDADPPVQYVRNRAVSWAVAQL